MSSIAQKLCNDIVHPVLSSSEVNNKNDLNNKSQIEGVKPPLYSQKKKSVNKNFSHSSNASNRGKATNIVFKKYFHNSAINTDISGSLQCDNNCITLVRKRNNCVICKCSNMQLNSKHRSKQIQTVCKRSGYLLDKSCTHCVETVSCGTQFFDSINSILRSNGSHSRSKSNVTIKIQESTKVIKHSGIRDREYKIEDSLKKMHNSNIESNTRVHLQCAGQKVWAISNYPIRGPDF